MGSLTISGKRVFLLEDDSYRIAWFRRVIGAKAQRLDIASEVEAGKRYLQERDYDLLFLDHDLAPEHYEALHGGLVKGCCEITGTGYDLAHWLAEQDIQRQALVIIHSLNPEGSERMAQALAAWKPMRVPFTVLSELSQGL